MAGRKTKKGIDWYGMSVNFYRNFKIQRIDELFPLFGIKTLLILYSEIYKNEGYFLFLGSPDSETYQDILDTISEEARYRIEPKEIDKVIKACIKIKLFDKKKHGKYRILTNKKIQFNYFEAIKRRNPIEIFSEYLLLNSLEMDAIFTKANLNNFNINTINTTKNDINSIDATKCDINTINVNECYINENEENLNYEKKLIIDEPIYVNQCDINSIDVTKCDINTINDNKNTINVNECGINTQRKGKGKRKGIESKQQVNKKEGGISRLDTIGNFEISNFPPPSFEKNNKNSFPVEPNIGEPKNVSEVLGNFKTDYETETKIEIKTALQNTAWKYDFDFEKMATKFYETHIVEKNRTENWESYVKKYCENWYDNELKFSKIIPSAKYEQMLKESVTKRVKFVNDAQYFTGKIIVNSEVHSLTKGFCKENGKYRNEIINEALRDRNNTLQIDDEVIDIEALTLDEIRI